jgi:hypothetical protein
MLTRTPTGKHFAECSETGAYLAISQKQWTLVYEDRERNIYEPRHWQRLKVSSSDILERAQKSLDKIIEKHKGE